MNARFLTAPQFWWQDQPSYLAKSLQPFSILYGKAVTRRMKQTPSYQSRIPVICIGNFVMGGAGKTPTTLALVNLLKARNKKPGILLRGFGRQSRETLFVDHNQHNARDVGDEALLYAPLVPTVVAHDRLDGAQLLESAPVDIILMDDGFQNPRLYKDCNMIVVDAQAGIGNGLVFPAGPLRAPLPKQMLYADAIILLGHGLYTQYIMDQAKRFKKPVFTAQTIINTHTISRYHNTKVIAFSGIGRPQKFFDCLENNGFILKDQFCFPDHYNFTETDAKTILKRADTLQAKPITTQKDQVRLAHAKPGSYRHALLKQSHVLPIKVEFDNITAFNHYMEAVFSRALNSASSDARTST